MTAARTQPRRRERVRQAVGARLPRPLVALLDRLRLYQVVACARLTTRPLAFAVHELRGGGRLRCHRLRASGQVLCLHHGTQDLGVIDEVHRLGFYDPPRAVAAALARLGAAPRVVDLGAHVGVFGLWAFARFPDATLLAVEPDEHNGAALERCIAANGLGGRWRRIAAAAATADGEATFAGGASSASHVVAGGEEEGTTVAAIDVLPELDGADLLKVDIEGAEWPILEDPRLEETRPRVMVLEYHPHLCPGGDPRARAEGRLAALGYALHPIFHDSSGVGMLWATREG